MLVLNLGFQGLIFFLLQTSIKREYNTLCSLLKYSNYYTQVNESSFVDIFWGGTQAFPPSPFPIRL